MKNVNPPRFLGELNKEKSSGLVYSLMSIVPVLLSLLFLIAIALFGLAKEGYDQQDWYIYCSYLLPQIGSLIIIILFIKWKQTSVKEICRPVDWKYFLVAIILQFGLLSLSELNTWFLQTLGKFGYEETQIQVPSMDGFGFIGVLFTIAVLPAVFEELTCRELLLKGLKGFGETFAILVSGALFALYHQRPEQTIYQFCCGAAFALVAIKANSVFPTMLSHFLNNALILCAEKYSWSLEGVWFTAISAVCLVASLAYLIFFDKKKGILSTEKGSKKDFFLFAGFGLFLFGFTWLSVLLSGL